MKKEELYERIGTDYYKTVYKPNIWGDKLKIRISWTAEAIRQDHGKDYLSNIPKFDGFCFFPSHIDYKYEFDGFINTYHEITHKPEKGNCDKIFKFIKHIFGEQYDLGLDYLTVLYKYPTQKLPILCLVSKERNTGKTTFLMFLKLIFQNNMTINTNEDFRSNFNSDWSHMHIVGVDETLLDRREDSEKIKTLSTAKTNKSEAKGKDKTEDVFIAKFVLCSNNEDNFIIIEPEETRYWVRKIQPFEVENDSLLSELELEIPYFLDFLLQRPLIKPNNKTRMWFDPSLLMTDALKKIKRRFINRTESELYELIREIFEKSDEETLCFTNSNIRNQLSKYLNIQTRTSDIRNILEKKLKLTQEQPSNYIEYYLDSTGYLISRSSKGRCYKLRKTDFEKIYEELMI